MPRTVYDQIEENNLKTGLLIVLFPAFLCLLMAIAFYFAPADRVWFFEGERDIEHSKLFAYDPRMPDLHTSEEYTDGWSASVWEEWKPYDKFGVYNRESVEAYMKAFAKLDKQRIFVEVKRSKPYGPDSKYEVIELKPYDPEHPPMTPRKRLLILFPFIVATALVWMGIAYYFGDRLMLFLGDAKRLDDKDNDQPSNRKIFHAVENIALAAGLPTPKLYLIEDPAMNAFTTGVSPKTASIVVTRGLIDSLEPLELEAVIAHEMAHIGNHDIRLYVLIIAGIGVFSTIGGFLMTMRLRNWLVIPAGLALWLFGVLFAPLIYLAISRSNEYRADATASLITRNPAALADALKKIKQDAYVTRLDRDTPMAVACIFDPRVRGGALAVFGSTHPKVEDRITRLNEMARRMESGWGG